MSVTLVKGGLSKWLETSLIIICLLIVGTYQIFAANISVTLTVPLTDAYKQLIAQNSSIVVDPSSSPIGSPIVVIVHMSDGRIVLVHHIIRIGVIAQNGVTVNEPTLFTDANGYVRATIQATVPGQFQVYAIDDTYLATDNQEILVNQSPDIVFTQINSQEPSPTPFPTTFVSPTVIQTPVVAPSTGTPSAPTTHASGLQVFGLRYSNMPSIGIILLLLFMLIYPSIWFFADADILLLKNTIFYTVIMTLSGFSLLALDLPYVFVLLVWIILFIEFSRIIIAQEYEET